MEQERELEAQVTTSTATETQVKADFSSGLEDLPRLEDLLKSEKEIKSEKKLEGLTAVKQQTSAQDRPFARAEDKKKVLVKRRLKTITGVYTCCIALLLAFVGFNLVTLVNVNKDINTNTKTIQSQVESVQIMENELQAPTGPNGEFTISLNEPRDYSDDTKELTFFDKISILFRNLFG